MPISISLSLFISYTIFILEKTSMAASRLTVFTFMRISKF